jgi:LPXTG-site transpeptidase (sortase) family protein
MKQHFPFKFAIAAAFAGLLCAGAADVLASPSGWLNVDGAIRRTSAVDWANSGPAGANCTNGGVNVTGTGGLFNCGIFNGSTTPPTPPLRISADPTIIATAFVSDPMSSDATTCPSGSGNGDSTTVQGGTNDDALNSYTISTGSVPIKDELTNVYAVSHTRADGHPEIYFAAERTVNNGDSHIDFEFLQSVVTRTASCGGTFTGHRSQGDLLVAADFSNGGQAATPSVWQWHCAPLPAPQPVDGTICDPGSGASYELLTPPPGTVAFVLNTTADIACGGWACRDSTGALTAVVPQFDFVEGGINLNDLGFTGCFNTFLPHTRTSNPFTAQLADFSGPQALPTCRTPVTNSAPVGTIAPGAPVHDTISLSNGGVATKPGGTVTFFLCSPSQVTGSGCPSGTQVGAPKTLAGGVATSDATSATSATGKYCWRTVYTPNTASLGMYSPGSHTNATTECFNVVVAASLPDTGVPETPWDPSLALQVLLIAPGALFLLAWRRGRSIAVVLIAGVIVGSSPSLTAGTHSYPGAGLTGAVQQLGRVAAGPAQIGGGTPRAMGWRLVIPRLGVDAQIQGVGKDRRGAMASPDSLETVGWFNRGPQPGQAGDAVIAGHLGLPSQPAVFSNLWMVRPGDAVSVVWPDGTTIAFRVTTLEVVPATAHPPGVFARSGASRLTLITCDGKWDQASRSYTDRLIVTAVPV